MNFKELCEANNTIKTIDVKGKNYAEVNQRIKAFRMLFPNGGIESEIVSLDAGVVVIKSTVRDEAGNILGTGLAYEHENSSFINKTSYIENCETSAVGRALGMCGFGIDVSIASYEEVANAINNQEVSKAKSVELPTSEEDAKDKCSDKQVKFIESLIVKKAMSERVMRYMCTNFQD